MQTRRQVSRAEGFTDWTFFFLALRLAEKPGVSVTGSNLGGDTSRDPGGNAWGRAAEVPTAEKFVFPGSNPGKGNGTGRSTKREPRPFSGFIFAQIQKKKHQKHYLIGLEGPGWFLSDVGTRRARSAGGKAEVGARQKKHHDSEAAPLKAGFFGFSWNRPLLGRLALTGPAAGATKSYQRDGTPSLLRPPQGIGTCSRKGR